MPKTCKCGHGAVDHDRWGKGACTPWLRDARGVVYVGKCDCKEADYAAVLALMGGAESD